ncbi:SusC/RagA family TonB-linked outer membrane protein [Bacteroidales bacterium]|nr:SusC/RagA family TonB-linked outer membrane protein [Bacteroidales bacterium]
MKSKFMKNKFMKKKMPLLLLGLCIGLGVSAETADRKFKETSLKIESRQMKLQTAQSDKKSITGTILDNMGMPVIGASIVVKGTSIGTVSDLDGRFTLEVGSESVLLVTYLGYVSSEWSVGNKKHLDIQLREDNKVLDEIVVVGYATIKKANLTGAVSVIDNKIIADRPITNLGQGLQGAIANLTITTSGRPGDASSFKIRGDASLSGGKPLILVDGVEMDPNLINPQDVASVSVLKDAASSAIYGARAAYGVMLITTKGGKKNQPTKVSFNSMTSFNSPTTRPKYMSSMQYADWMNAANTTDNGRNYFDAQEMEHIRNHYQNPSLYPSVFVHSNPDMSSQGKKYSYASNTDWMDELYAKSYPIQNYNIAINGGSEKVTYYTSGGFMDQGSLLRFGNEGFKKFNIMNNISYDINDWLNIGLKTTFNRTELSGLNQSRIHGDNFIGADTRPIMPVKHPDGNWSGQGNYTNFAAILEDAGSRTTYKNDFWNTLSAKLKPFQGATINFDYTFNLYNENTKIHIKKFNEYGVDGQLLQTFAWTNPNGVAQSQKDDTYNALNLFADYEKDLGSHYLKGLVGFNQEEKHFRSFSSERRNLASNDIPSMNTATGERYVSNFDNSWAIRGTFVRLNYIYDERYLMELNARYDLSSRFPKNDRAAFNPSASVGWRISNEAFFEGAKSLVDELKIRASYGSLGNQSLEDEYQPYLTSLSTGIQPWLMGNQQNQYITAGRLVSPTLTWETAKQWDLGVDFVLLNNRLKGTFDYYERRTSNILMRDRELPNILGASEPLVNSAEINTKGWEFEISWNNVLPNGLYYSFGFNIADYQATVTKYDNPTGDIGQYYVGRKLNEIWGYETLGLFQSESEISAAPDHSLLAGRHPLTGELMFADKDGNGEINWGNNTLANPGDQSIIGNSTPRYQYGFRGSAEWQNFDFSFFMQGVGKRDIRLPNKLFLEHYSSEWSVPSAINADYWTENNRDAQFPRPSFNAGGFTNRAQTRFLQDGSYLRLKSLTLGYTIPTSILTKISVDKLRVFVTGENLLTFKNTSEGFDPELSDPYKYPLQKSFAFGLSITL